MSTKEFPRQVLVSADGSELSLLAASTAANIAKTTGAPVTIVHVIRSMQEYYRMRAAADALKQGIPQSIVKKILAQSEQDAKSLVKKAKTIFKEEGISVSTKITREIDPADGILKAAGKEHDLIIMGAHGEEVKDRYTLGSIAKKVVRHSVSSTLIIKRECSFLNILVCVDGSRNSMEALNHAAKLANKLHSKITLLNVQEPKLFAFSHMVARDLGEHILTQAESSIEGSKLEIESLLEFGKPSDHIVNLAQKRNHDLIVLGRKGMGTVKHFLLGSVSDKVSHRAKCSVLIVPMHR